MFGKSIRNANENASHGHTEKIEFRAKNYFSQSIIVLFELILLFLSKNEG